jgi:hypothetical protein
VHTSGDPLRSIACCTPISPLRSPRLVAATKVEFSAVSRTRMAKFRALEEVIVKYNKFSERERLALKSEELFPLNLAILAAPIYGFAAE